MTFFVLRELPEIPRAISLSIGDAVHNLRTALDYLACALVVHNGNTPKNVYFPIAETLARYQTESPSKTKGMALGTKKLIDDLHPHGEGNSGFYALHLLDIIDKHRLLPTVAMGIGNWNVSLSSKTTLVGFNMPQNRNQPFGLRKNDFIGMMPGNHVSDKEMSATVQLAFSEPEMLVGEIVLSTLKSLADMVRYVLKFFESKVEGAPDFGGSDE
jgi:hypothetical protein